MPTPGRIRLGLVICLAWTAAAAGRPGLADQNPRPARTCDQQAAAIGAWLRELAAIVRPDLPSYPQVNWVILPGPADWPQGLRGPLVEIKLRRATLNGDPLPDGLIQRGARLQAVRHRFATLNQLRRGAGKDPAPPPVLLLAVDADEPWEEVCKLAQAASQAGFDRFGLLLAHPEPDGLRRPGPSSIDGPLAELEDSQSPGERTRLLAGILRRVLGRCPQLVTTFGSLASLAPSDRAAALAEQLPTALSGCGCKVEQPALERLLWHMLYTPPLSVLIAPLAGPDEAEPLTIRVPGDQRWRQVLPVLRKALARDAVRPLVFEPAL